MTINVIFEILGTDILAEVHLQLFVLPLSAI